MTPTPTPGDGKESMNKFKSIALWPSDARCPGNESSDLHDTKEQAEAVCRLLETRGFGGDGVYFPRYTTVVEVIGSSMTLPNANTLDPVTVRVMCAENFLKARGRAL